MKWVSANKTKIDFGIRITLNSISTNEEVEAIVEAVQGALASNLNIGDKFEILDVEHFTD